MQVDPIEPTLKSPEIKRLKLTYDEPLSSFAFNGNLRPYIKGTLVPSKVNFKGYRVRKDEGGGKWAGPYTSPLFRST